MRLASLGIAAFATSLVLSLSAGCATGGAEDADSSENDLMGDGTTVDLRGKRVLLLPFPYSQQPAPAHETAQEKADRLKENTEARNDSACFVGAAKQAKAFYESKGAIVTLQPVGLGPDGDDGLLAILKRFADGPQKTTFDRIITFSHGGADGPVFGNDGEEQGLQIGWDWPNDRLCSGDFEAEKCRRDKWLDGMKEDDDGNWHDDPNAHGRPAADQEKENLGALQDLGTAIAAITTPDAFVWLGACNPAKQSNIDPDFNFLEIVTCISGRQALGANTKTSCVDMAGQVASLEKTGRRPRTIQSADPVSLAQKPKPLNLLACTR